MASRKRSGGRPLRPLLFLLLIVAAIFGSIGAGTKWGDASFTPELALDLEGGTQIILTPNTTDGQDVTSDDVNQAIAIIRQRVDGSGVSEAEITSQGGRNIVVALPGNPSQETIDLVSASAVMRMRVVLVEAGPGTIDPSALEPTEEPTDGATDDPSAEPTDADASPDGALPRETTPTPEPTDAATEEPTDAATEEPTDAATDAPPATPEEIDAAAFAAADADGDGELSNTPATEPTSASDTAWITEQVTYDFYRLDCSLPENRTGGGDDDPDAPLVACTTDGAAKYILGPAELSGSDLTSAQMVYQTTSTGMATNIPIVQMNFTSEGGDIFGEITGRISTLTPPQNQFAIVLDGNVISAPRVSQAIPNGEAIIEGPTDNPFTREQAQTLANQLNFGSLPITFDVQSQEQISATLGGEQLEKGLLAGLIGLALVVIYSLFQYRGLAVVTIASLVVAAAITYGAILLLSWLQGYRLSLPGVAGLIVAIGITADSFIVYFERIRDEVREGRTLDAAVEQGWVRARRTILASDAVNFLAAVVLYFLAVGGVRGFAFTLGLTTLVDLLVVFLFTHPMVRLLARTRFFGEGHPLSGLDPVHLGASVATYAGRGRTRSRAERTAVAANASRMTIAERRAAEARASSEDADDDGPPEDSVAATSARDGQEEGR